MFLLVPVRTDSPLRSAPWANWFLIIANIAVFVAEHSPVRGLFANWALNSARPELYQFVTYAFMHDGPLHIAGNMLFLYIFGNNICDRLGNMAFLAFYVGGAIFAGIGYAALNQTGLVVGASGAVAAVTGAYLALLPRSHITLFYWLFIMIGLTEVPSLWFILAFFAQDVFYSFSRSSDVAHIAHVSGSVFGFALCMLILKFRLLPRDHFDMLALVDRWNRRRTYNTVVRTGYDPFGYTRPGNSSKGSLPPASVEQSQELRAQISEAVAHGDLAAAGELYKKLRAMDPSQTLARATQLDVASHYYSAQDYRSAADAYALYLKNYPGADQAGQVSLMLGLAYGRHLGQPGKAREYLLDAVRLLQFSRELDIAKSELMRLEMESPPA